MSIETVFGLRIISIFVSLLLLSIAVSVYMDGSGKLASAISLGAAGWGFMGVVLGLNKKIQPIQATATS